MHPVPVQFWPQMTISRTVHKIVVDWIAFRLTLSAPSNYWSVKRIFDTLTKRDQWVKAVAPGPGGAEIAFDVRLQDPSHLRSLWSELQFHWPSCTATLTGLEVALDTYIKDADAITLAVQLANQFMWMEFPSRGRWHLYRKPGERPRQLSVGDGVSRSEFIERLADQWQLADYSNKEVPARFHMHVKTTDAGALSLPQNLWRARFELTLKPPALPWNDLGELATADFTFLKKWFRLRKQAARLHPSISSALGSRHFPADFQAGKRGTYARPGRPGARRKGDVRKFRSISAANTKVNSIIYDRLRRLRGEQDA